MTNSGSIEHFSAHGLAARVDNAARPGNHQGWDVAPALAVAALLFPETPTKRAADGFHHLTLLPGEGVFVEVE